MLGRPRGGLGIATLVLTVIGLGIATYLTYIHYRGIRSVCAIAHGCEIVQSSEYSKFVGVPVATLGLIGYVLIFASLWVRSEEGLLATTALSWIGFAFSLYLTYREIWTIEAICIWCVSSAIILTLLTILSTVSFLRTDPTTGRAHASPAAGG
jgi:uncharacterized membrane protein